MFRPMMEGAGGVGVIVGNDKGTLGKPSTRGAIVGVSVGVGVSTLILIIDPPAMPSITTGDVVVGVGVAVGVGGSTLMLIIIGAGGGPPPQIFGGRQTLALSESEAPLIDATLAVFAFPQAPVDVTLA